MDLILFLAGVFLVTFFAGRLLEKVHIPWIFSALLIGLVLAVYNPFTEVTSSDSFQFLSELGMFFLLFIIGFELSINKIRKQGTFIIKTTTAIILAETILGSLLIHCVFGTSWLIAILVATSFATIGEAVLLPILDEFKLVNTNFGQTILSIGVLDDVVEILVIIVASFIIGRSTGHEQFNIWINLLILCSLFGLVFVLTSFQNKISTFKFKDIPSFFLFVIFILFLFIGIGRFVESGALGAIMGGIALRNIVPEHNLKFVDSEMRTMAYAFFAPVFFLSVGINTDMGIMLRASWLILLIVLVTACAKIGMSYIVGRKKFGSKKSIIMGVSLMVKLSTSIVIINLLFNMGIIQSELYSALVISTTLFTTLTPILITYLLHRWKIGFKKTKAIKSSQA